MTFADYLEFTSAKAWRDLLAMTPETAPLELRLFRSPSCFLGQRFGKRQDRRAVASRELRPERSQPREFGIRRLSSI